MTTRGRGIDFEHRFNTSRWAEDLLLRSLNKPDSPLIGVRYGLSAVRVGGAINVGDITIKEPDIIVYRKDLLTASEKAKIITHQYDLSEVDRAQFLGDGEWRFAIEKASAAIEVEFSPYRASEMAKRDWLPKTNESWERRPLVRAEPPVAPNIWVKVEDLGRLTEWGARFGVPVLIAHLFDQEAFAIPLSKILEVDSRISATPADAIKIQHTTGIFKKEQSYDRIDAQGARETKMVFVVTPNVATKVGDVSGVNVSAQIGLSASKKYVSHVVFSEGELHFSPEFLALINSQRTL